MIRFDGLVGSLRHDGPTGAARNASEEVSRQRGSR